MFLPSSEEAGLVGLEPVRKGRPGWAQQNFVIGRRHNWQHWPIDELEHNHRSLLILGCENSVAALGPIGRPVLEGGVQADSQVTISPMLDNVPPWLTFQMATPIGIAHGNIWNGQPGVGRPQSELAPQGPGLHDDTIGRVWLRWDVLVALPDSADDLVTATGADPGSGCEEHVIVGGL